MRNQFEFGGKFLSEGFDEDELLELEGETEEETEEEKGNEEEEEEL